MSFFSRDQCENLLEECKLKQHSWRKCRSASLSCVDFLHIALGHQLCAPAGSHTANNYAISEHEKRPGGPSSSVPKKRNKHLSPAGWATCTVAMQSTSTGGPTSGATAADPPCRRNGGPLELPKPEGRHQRKQDQQPAAQMLEDALTQPLVDELLSLCSWWSERECGYGPPPNYDDEEQEEKEEPAKKGTPATNERQNRCGPDPLGSPAVTDLFSSSSSSPFSSSSSSLSSSSTVVVVAEAGEWDEHPFLGPLAAVRCGKENSLSANGTDTSLSSEEKCYSFYRWDSCLHSNKLVLASAAKRDHRVSLQQGKSSLASAGNTDWDEDEEMFWHDLDSIYV